MNTTAEQHLSKACDYVARGEEFYRKAAEEIVAAQSAEPTLSNYEIANRLGKSESYVRRLVTAHTNASRAADGTFEVDWESGSNVRSEVTSKELRDSSPQQIAETYLSDPDVRDKVGRAMDKHYTEKVAKRKQASHEREVEERGGPDEHAAFERRQRIVEVINVARGLATGMRFVADEVKRLNLDEFEEAGSVGELLRCVEEVEGFATILRQFLSGAEITDEDIAEFIGSGK